MRRLAAVSLAAAVSACSGNAPFLASLRIEGNSSISDTELRKAAEGCAGPQDCADLVDFRYTEEGFLASTVTPEQSLLQRWTGSKSGTLRVTEGPRFKVSAVVFTEIPAPAADALGDAGELAALTTLRPGADFHVREVSTLLDAVANRYAAAGYSRANVTPLTTLDMQTNTIAITIEIERGVRTPTTSPK